MPDTDTTPETDPTPAERRDALAPANDPDRCQNPDCRRMPGICRCGDVDEVPPRRTPEQIRQQRTDNDFTLMHVIVMAGATPAKAAKQAASKTTGVSMLRAGYEEWLIKQVGPVGHAFLVDDENDVWVLIGADARTGQAVYANWQGVAESDTIDAVYEHRTVLRALAIEDEYGIKWRGPAVALRPTGDN